MGKLLIHQHMCLYFSWLNKICTSAAFEQYLTNLNCMWRYSIMNGSLIVLNKQCLKALSYPPKSSRMDMYTF